MIVAKKPVSKKKTRRVRMLHDRHFPGESARYRAARNALLNSERSLRALLEAVAAKRRKLPLGGAVPEDYAFEALGPNGAPQTRRMSELFEPGKDTLIIYSFMFGPEMAEPCPYCTSILDGLDGQSPHVNQRANFFVVAKSPIERVTTFARERAWTRLRLLSSAGNTYNRDYFGEDAKGEQTPSLNVFIKRGGRVYHFYHSELMFVAPERGQDPRHVDLIWPVWQLLDVTPEGRPPKWGPRLHY
jgi:predicted dithiol-disulfide oxidoreductase (DUF899 family)